MGIKEKGERIDFVSLSPFYLLSIMSQEPEGLTSPNLSSSPTRVRCTEPLMYLTTWVSKAFLISNANSGIRDNRILRVAKTSSSAILRKVRISRYFYEQAVGRVLVTPMALHEVSFPSRGFIS
jgi:hypothetical protein